MDKYDDDADYDDYRYEGDEYDDAADDWEAEAEEQEQKTIAEEAARQARLEKKLATRAPIKEEEVVEVVPEDVEQAIAHMRQVANDIASGSALLSGGDSAEVIGEKRCNSDADAERVGAMIAERLIFFADSDHYETLIMDVFERLTSHIKSTQLLNEEADRVHRLRSELKRVVKAKPKPVKTSVKQGGLDLDTVEDKGGAAVPEENEDETGW